MSSNIKVDDLTMRSHYILRLAQTSVASRKEVYLSPESILFAILMLYKSVAMTIMISLGVDRDQLEERIKRDSIMARRQQGEARESGNPVPSNDANPYEIIERAREQSRLLKHNAVGSEHFLLAILASDGIARQALNDAGITYEAVRARIVDICEGNV